MTIDAPRPATAGVRLAIRRIHLWFGLTVGLLFALLGLTGSALVFYTAIDGVLHPVVQAERSAPAPDWQSPIWDRALATGRTRWNNPGGKWTFEVTGEPGAIPARYYAMPGRHGDRMMVWFSPDGTRIVRAEPWGGYLMSWLYQLHMQLLAGEFGRQLVGWSGVAMLILIVTGLFAWWPRGSWRKAVAFKRAAAPIRRLHDIHKLSGLWSAVVLLILVGSGILLALPDVTQALVRPAALPAPRSSGQDGKEISVADALGIAHRAMPDGRLTFLDVPNARDAPMRMRFQLPGDPHPRFPGSYVFVDRTTGRVLAVHDVRRNGSGTTVASWIRTLHDGTVGGMATRILAVLAGLMPAILFATGVLRWRRRRRGTTPAMRSPTTGRDGPVSPVSRRGR